VSLFQIDAVKDIERWAARNEKYGRAGKVLTRECEWLEIIVVLRNEDRRCIRRVLQLDLQAPRLETELIARNAICACHHVSMRQLVGHAGGAMRTVVLYLTGDSARLKNNSHPRDDVHAKDTASPRIFQSADFSYSSQDKISAATTPESYATHTMTTWQSLLVRTSQ